jgi:hypothetical protein
MGNTAFGMCVTIAGSGTEAIAFDPSGPPAGSVAWSACIAWATAPHRSLRRQADRRHPLRRILTERRSLVRCWQ